MAEKVVVLWGEEPVQRYFNVVDRSEETVDLLLKHIDVYEFATVEEAEAFRFGVCAVKSPSANDFCELTVQGLESLHAIKQGEKLHLKRGR